MQCTELMDINVIFVFPHTTCGTLELAVTFPSFFRNSSSSCMDILLLVAGMLYDVVVLDAAFADISDLSLAFCCRNFKV